MESRKGFPSTFYGCDMMQKASNHWKGCKTPAKQIFEFLNITGVNWRNAVYIECRYCEYRRSDLCVQVPDFLAAPDRNGIPLLLPVSDARCIFARQLDKTECLLVISNLRFQTLFEFYIHKTLSDETKCPLLELHKQSAIFYGGTVHE